MVDEICVNAWRVRFVLPMPIILIETMLFFHRHYYRTKALVLLFRECCVWCTLICISPHFSWNSDKSTKKHTQYLMKTRFYFVEWVVHCVQCLYTAHSTAIFFDDFCWSVPVIVFASRCSSMCLKHRSCAHFSFFRHIFLHFRFFFLLRLFSHFLFFCSAIYNEKQFHIYKSCPGK